MSDASRILFVDDAPAEWQLAFSTLADNGLLNQATAVKDRDEALDFLHARGNFRRKPTGLPAVVIIGPNINGSNALSVLSYIRTDATLRRVPVVIIAAAPDAELVRSAYMHGANSVVRRDDDVKVHAERFAALARFWAWANEPPPGCLPPPKTARRS